MVHGSPVCPSSSRSRDRRPPGVQHGGECDHGPHLTRGLDGWHGGTATVKSEEHQQVLHHLSKQQWLIQDQLVATKPQMSQQLWDWVTQAIQPGSATPLSSEPGRHPVICILKLMVEDDPKYFLKAFKMSTRAAGWATNH